RAGRPGSWHLVRARHLGTGPWHGRPVLHRILPCTGAVAVHATCRPDSAWPRIVPTVPAKAPGPTVGTACWRACGWAADLPAEPLAPPPPELGHGQLSDVHRTERVDRGLPVVPVQRVQAGPGVLIDVPPVPVALPGRELHGRRQELRDG